MIAVFPQLEKKYSTVKNKLLPNWGKNGEESSDLPAVIPETGSDVYQFISRPYSVQALIGSWLAQPSQMPDVRTNLDVVETAPANGRRKDSASAVPGHFQIRIAATQITRQSVDGSRIGIASHETDAGNVRSIFRKKLIHCRRSQRFADIAPQVRAMTTRTTTRAVGQIDGQRHFIGNFLKHDVGIDILKHNLFINNKLKNFQSNSLPATA